jgi:hypothetical protein
MILDGYGVMTAFSFLYTPSCEPCLSADLFVISTLERYLRGGGKGGVIWYFRRRRTGAERSVNEGINEEGIVRMVHRTPRTSMQRIARHFRVPHTRVWRTLHGEVA